MKEYENNYQAKAAQEPDNPYWQYMAGEAFLQAGDYLPAMPFFEKALELAPYHPESKRGCAICLVMSGRHEQGLALCAELLASVPIDFTALLLSAEALIGLERHQEAAKAYSQRLRSRSADATQTGFAHGAGARKSAAFCHGDGQGFSGPATGLGAI